MPHSHELHLRTTSAASPAPTMSAPVLARHSSAARTRATCPSGRLEGGSARGKESSTAMGRSSTMAARWASSKGTTRGRGPACGRERNSGWPAAPSSGRGDS
ncbi:hypothetical protein PVAP13_9NG659400 [Panicum virgatum]|uniref:Uncharacterized protein n=1 Tax=Panicum virgatum TaxID=38727 RepID=A0A8T0N0M4_PANVG|nr:hypothetical protein PVAP13_9NG659400 [Panicum virgatum]